MINYNLTKINGKFQVLIVELGTQSREILGHVFREKNKHRWLFHCMNKFNYHWVLEGSRCSRFVWWHMAKPSQLCCIKSQPGSKINE